MTLRSFFANAKLFTKLKPFAKILQLMNNGSRWVRIVQIESKKSLTKYSPQNGENLLSVGKGKEVIGPLVTHYRGGAHGLFHR